jgi:hypothetical protein
MWHMLLPLLQALSWAFNPDTGTVESWQGWLPRGATNMYKQLVIVGEQHLPDCTACAV